MSILNIKIHLEAGYNATNACWNLTEGDIAHVKAGDELAVLSSVNWANAPQTVTVTGVTESGFAASPAPAAAQEGSPVEAVLVKTYALTDPVSLQWDIADLDSSEGSGVNQLGQTFRDRIAVKRTIGCGWGPLGQSEMSTLLQSMKDLFFYLTFPDAQKGDMDEMEVYVSNKSAPLYRLVDGQDWKWTSMSVTFTER